MKGYALLSAILFFAVTSAFSQKLKQNGDLSFLKGQEKVNVEFVYDDVVVGKENEAEYVQKKMDEREEDEMGGGEKWRDKWIGDRETHFKPGFLELINKTTGDDVEFGDFPDAEYTLRFHVTRLEPGWNIGISRKPAEIDGIAYFGKTGSEPEANVTINRAPGSQAFGGDYEVSARLKESFAISGKRLGSLLKKKAL